MVGVDLCGIARVFFRAAYPFVGHGVHLNVGDAIDLDEIVQVVVSAEAGEYAAPTCSFVGGFKNGTHLCAIVDTPGILNALVHQDDHRFGGGAEGCLKPGALLFANVSGVATGRVLVAVVAIEDYESIALLEVGVMSLLHANVLAKRFAAGTSVHVVVSHHIVLIALPAVPNLTERIVRFYGLTEITHLHDKVRALLDHALEVCAEALIRVVHDVLMYICAHAEAQLFQALGGLGRWAEAENTDACCRAFQDLSTCVHHLLSIPVSIMSLPLF